MLIRNGIQGRARGHVSITGPDGTVERETFTCAHCSQVVIVKLRAAPDELGGNCRHCDAMVCAVCVQRDQGRCKPFEKRVEEYEARHRFLSQVG